MSQGFHLFQLQKIDTQLDQGAARIRDINQFLAADHRIKDQQDSVDRAGKELAAAQAQLKKIEQDISARRIKLEQCEASLYGGKVRVPKELQDLQTEAASIKRAVSNLEDQQLEAMILVESAQETSDIAKKSFLNLQADIASENVVLAGEITALKTLIDRLSIEREAVSNQIEPHLRDEYDRLRKNKRGIAVASMVDNACTGCGTVLTPADRQAARAPNIVFHCPSCSRFIYAG